jgi:hypothetical protein
LRELGVDIRNPLQLLYVLKKLGPGGFEQLFVPDAQALLSPLTDMFSMSQLVIDKHRPMFLDVSFRNRVKGMHLLVASSDVHEHAAGALAQLLDEAGAEVVYLGAEQDPADLVAALRQQPANQLKRLLADESIELPVIMGGVLNQKVDTQALPVAVVDELRALGMHPANSLPGLVKLLPRQK